MYSRYLKERQGLEVIENDKGFIVYRVEEDCVFISDTYIEPEFRRTRACYDFADSVFKIAKENNKKMVVCQVDISTKNYIASMLVILNYGFEIYGMEKNEITFFKKVE